MALNTTNGSAILNPDEVSELVVRPLIEQACQRKSRRSSAPTRTRCGLPIVTADPTVGWALEGSELAVSDSTLSEIVLVPKKLAGLTVVTNELAADSDVALEQIGQGLVRDLQRKLDAAYFGSTDHQRAVRARLAGQHRCRCG